MKTIFRCLAVLFLFHSSLFSQDTSTVKYLPLKVGIRVNIIESRYSSHSHNFDSIWHHVATAVGCSCNIVPYSFLDDTSNIENTDILIISAGCITIPMYGTRIETIKKYLTHGRNVYFQTEYSSTMTTNYAFSYIVNQLGGSFTWTMTVGGNFIQ